MLSRIISIHSRAQFRLISHIFSPSNTPKLPFYPHSKLLFYPRPFSTGSNGDGGQNGHNPNSDIWKISQENDSVDEIFGDQLPDETESKKAEGGDDLDDVFGNRVEKVGNEKKDEWALGDGDGDGGGGVFEEFLEAKSGDGEDGDGERRGHESEYVPWKIGGEEGDEKGDDLFGIEDETGFRRDEMDDKIREEIKMIQKLKLTKEEQSLLEIIKGPDRAFGDLVAASGITDAMLDSLIALKNFEDIEGLPPLKKIEDDRHLKTLMKSSRYEMEIQKQEDAAKARVRKIDDKGRAYGTGKRKCSIARVWIQPGDGQFSINDKEFDVYFPMLDHRAALLRPFSETKTLGLWDVHCTVKGGGTTGQVGAIRLGISRALQNWEPGLRPPLKEAGFLTRDPRIVERKKPGKAKARKSFQWVKR